MEMFSSHENREKQIDVHVVMFSIEMILVNKIFTGDVKMHSSNAHDHILPQINLLDVIESWSSSFVMISKAMVGAETLTKT